MYHVKKRYVKHFTESPVFGEAPVLWNTSRKHRGGEPKQFVNEKNAQVVNKTEPAPPPLLSHPEITLNVAE